MIEKKHTADGVESKALYSPCEQYRYLLRRRWDKKGKRALFIGLNPSTATEQKNDPTITRMIGFTKQWGYGSITICNLFSYRATMPTDLKQAEDPVGEKTDEILQKEIKKADLIIAAWGNHGTFKERNNEVQKYLKDYSHFGITKAGEPRHVLYLRKDEELIKNDE